MIMLTLGRDAEMLSRKQDAGKEGFYQTGHIIAVSALHRTGVHGRKLFQKSACGLQSPELPDRFVQNSIGCTGQVQATNFRMHGQT